MDEGEKVLVEFLPCSKCGEMSNILITEEDLKPIVCFSCMTKDKENSLPRKVKANNLSLVVDRLDRIEKLLISVLEKVK